MSDIQSVLVALQQLDASLEALHATAAAHSRTPLRNALQTIARRLDDPGVERRGRMTTVAEAAEELGVAL